MRWTQSDCVAALKAAAPADPGAALLRSAYDAWRREHPGHPSSQTIVWKAGTWAEALWAAELVSEYGPSHVRAPEVRGCIVLPVVPQYEP